MSVTRGNGDKCDYGKATRQLVGWLLILIVVGSGILIGVAAAADSKASNNLERIHENAENMARIDERLKSLGAKMDVLLEHDRDSD